jgi:hypothetical protein
LFGIHRSGVMLEHIFIWLTSQMDVSDRERDLLHQVSELQAR